MDIIAIVSIMVMLSNTIHANSYNNKYVVAMIIVDMVTHKIYVILLFI